MLQDLRPENRIPSLALLALLAAILAPAPALAQEQEAPRYTLVVQGQTYTLPYQSAMGVQFVPLSALAEILRTTLQRDPVSGDVAMNIGRSRVGVSMRQPFASLDNRLVPLDAAPLQTEGEVWVSVDFLTEAVAPALREPVRHDRNRKRIEIGGEKPLRVYMRAVTHEGGTRLTFEFSRKVPYSIRKSRRKLYLTLDTRSFQAPFQIEEIDSPVVRRVKLLRSEREKGFVIELKRQFSSYELKEVSRPPALVVELRRRGYESGPLVEEPPAAAPFAPVGTAEERRPALPPPLRPKHEEDSRPVIVLDPGHGGEEKGAIGPSGLLEKDITLDVAQRLRTRLEADGLRVVLTRNDDHTLPLVERTALANHHRAELFVSIHANASRRMDASGAETYFLSYQATDAEAQALAALENAADIRREGGSVRDDLRMVLWDLQQAEHLRESSALAEVIQAQLNALLRLRNRGVRQAPFRVLMGADMPAVLIEIGFITNPEEEEKLRSPAYRESLALTISQSIERFRETVLGQIPRPGAARTGIAR
ncbi:MAG: N-acetylmuramoyl-L-alanine amidase [Acidobacteriota bacterium]